MSMRRNLLLPFIGMGLIFLAAAAGAAEGEPAETDGAPKAGGLSSLLGALGDLQIPSLSGLIQPERMGVLTDNQCRVTDNQPHLMSDNKADRDFQSGNQLNVLSGLHLLSDISVTVQVTVRHGDREAAKPKKTSKKPDVDRKSNKSKKRKATDQKKDQR